jgi:hypothetical protein
MNVGALITAETRIAMVAPKKVMAVIQFLVTKKHFGLQPRSLEPDQNHGLLISALEK